MSGNIEMLRTTSFIPSFPPGRFNSSKAQFVPASSFTTRWSSFARAARTHGLWAVVPFVRMTVFAGGQSRALHAATTSTIYVGSPFPAIVIESISLASNLSDAAISPSRIWFAVGNWPEFPLQGPGCSGALTIDVVEVAKSRAGGQRVHSERLAEPARIVRTEDRLLDVSVRLESHWTIYLTKRRYF